MSVTILELPYIFGQLPVLGWRPLWTPLIRYLRMSPIILYMEGGSACISAETVGRAAFAASQGDHNSRCYPIGQENLRWSEMLVRLATADGRRVQVVTIPSALLSIGLFLFWFIHKLQMREDGLDPCYFLIVQTAETLIDPELSLQALFFAPADLDDSFLKTAQACQE